MTHMLRATLPAALGTTPAASACPDTGASPHRGTQWPSVAAGMTAAPGAGATPRLNPIAVRLIPPVWFTAESAGISARRVGIAGTGVAAVVLPATIGSQPEGSYRAP